MFALLNWTVHESSAAPVALRARRQRRALPWDAYQCPLRHASLAPGLISRLKVTSARYGRAALSRSRRIIAKHRCRGIAGGPSKIAILNKTVVPGGELIAVLAALCW